jgi:transcriptional regulator with XRE-family HTH domain
VTGDPEDLRALGARIRGLRKREGLTLDGFAAKAGVNRARLNAWECGMRDPGIGGLLRISGALGVSPSRLLGERKTPQFSPGVEQIAIAIAELVAADHGDPPPAAARVTTTNSRRKEPAA